MEDQNERYYLFGFGVGTDQNINMVRGDTFAFGLEIDGIDQDLETAFFTVRKSYDGDIIFQRSIGNGVEKVETGLYSIRIAPENTKELEAGHYYYDFEIGLNSDVFTLAKGDLLIEQDTTF